MDKYYLIIAIVGFGGWIALCLWIDSRTNSKSGIVSTSSLSSSIKSQDIPSLHEESEEEDEYEFSILTQKNDVDYIGP